jgi:hypothetical protein
VCLILSRVCGLTVEFDVVCNRGVESIGSLTGENNFEGSLISMVYFIIIISSALCSS